MESRVNLFTPGIPEEVQSQVIEFTGVVSPSAECMKGLFKIMYWEAEDDDGSEGFLFNLAEWRNDPYDHAVGGHVKDFIMPACTFVCGNNRAQWRRDDPEYGWVTTSLIISSDRDLGWVTSRDLGSVASSDDLQMRDYDF